MRVEDAASRSKQEKTKKIILDSLRKRTSYLLKKPVLEDKDLYYYIKDFFREYLDIDKELTFEEINTELDKNYIPKDIKMNIKDYLDSISEIEYKDISYDEDQIKKHIENFYEVAKALPDEDKKTNNPIYKLLEKIGFKKTKDIVIEGKQKQTKTETERGSVEDETKIDTQEEVKESQKNTMNTAQEEVKNDTDDMNVYDLISKAKNIQDRDEKIKLYKEINELYEKESVEERAKIYPELLAIYDKIAKE